MPPKQKTRGKSDKDDDSKQLNLRGDEDEVDDTDPDDDDDDDDSTQDSGRSRRRNRRDDDDDDDTGNGSGASPLNVENNKLKNELKKWKTFARKHEQTAKENYDKLQELEGKDKSDVERLTSKVSKAEQERDEAHLKVARAEIALEYGLTMAEAKRLQGTTREELEEDAEELVELLAARRKTKRKANSKSKKRAADDIDDDDDDDIDDDDDDADDDDDEDDEDDRPKRRSRRTSTRDSRKSTLDRDRSRGTRMRPKERLRPGASSGESGDTRTAKEIADAVKKSARGF